MREMSFFAAFLLATATIGFAHAAAGIECVKTQCEGNGRQCVEALHVTYNACTKAARAKCDKISPAEKFNCLRDGLRPCALTRNAEQAACLSEVMSCYRTCDPLPGKRNDYWCVADFNDGVTAAFCAADPSASSPIQQCTKAFNRPGVASMTCDGLVR
jgi:hypothetical protein